MRPNEYLRNSIWHINKHGIDCSFIEVNQAEYDVESGTAIETNVNHDVKVYKKHFKASQYNYPDLVNKDTAMFYIANNTLGFIPKVRDKIIHDSITYLIDNIQEHRALGIVCLYRIIAYKV